VGSRVRCPRCGQTFQVTAEAPAEPVKPAVKQAQPAATSPAAAADAIPMAEMIEDDPVPAAELDEDEAMPAAVRVEKKKKRGSSVGLWIAVAGILFALLFGGAAVLYYGFSKVRVALALAGGNAIAGWEPDPVLVEYLDQDIKLTPLDLHIKVSKKAPVQARDENGRRVWRITQLGSDLDGEGTNLNVSIEEKPQGPGNNPLITQGLFQLQLPNSPISQSGTINGIPFTRVRIQGPYKGFIYYGMVDKYVVTFSSRESDQTSARLKLAESAVLTLHKE
jgi:hypothetical protein